MRRWMTAMAVTFTAAAPALFPPGAAAHPDLVHERIDATQNKNAYMIGYSHLDTQWRWTYLDTIGEYLPKTLHDNFALFEKHPDYVFNFTGSRRYRMIKEYYPKDYATMKEYIRQKRWYPTGSSVEENDVNVPSVESLIRNSLYGNDYFYKEFGTRPVDFILPDCFGFPASLPSVLAHVGAKGFSTQKLSWGSAAGIPFTVGVWEGPDSQSVIAALDAGPYVGTVNEDLSQSQFLLDRINNIGNRSGAYVDYRYYGAGDTGGAPTPGSVEWVEKSKQGTGPVKVIGGPADRLFLDLKPENVARMERYKGDLELTEHSAGSITSQAYMKRWNRKNELLADSAERASVGAMWLGGLPYPQQKLTSAWELVLGSQMHDILPGTSVPKAYEYSWNDEVVALNRFASTLESAVGVLARGMDTRAQGVPVVVYNPLSIEREDVVEATVRFPSGTPQRVRVFGPAGETPSQVTGREGSAVRVLFLAKAPSVGLATYDVRPSGSASALNTGLKATESSLENSRYRVTLDSRGDVSQIFDKTAGRNLLSGPARLAFKFEEPQSWPAWNIDWKDQSLPPVGYVEGPAKVRVVESGPVRVALEVTRESMGSRFVQRISLAANGAGDRVEFDNDILWNTRKHTLKTEFPLSVANENATYNMGLGTIERSTNDPKKYEVVHHQWFDLTDAKGDYGVTVMEDSKFGSDKPDDHTLRLTLIRTPGARSYEDQATQDIGRHRVLYALAGHQGDWRRGKSPWEAARLNQPLMAFQTSAHTGSLGKSLSLFRVSTNQVSIGAIKKAENSNEIIVRLHELNGATAANVRVTASAPIAAAREVNGQELPVGPARLEAGSLVVDMRPYNPRAFALKLGAPAARLAPPISRPLTIPHNMAAATRDGEASIKGLDGQGHSLSAELLPTTLVSEGVTFRLAPGGAGRKSAMASMGQKIALPGGAFTSVYILAAATGADQRGTFQVDGKAVPLTIQDWGGFIGQWDNRVWQVPEGSGARRAEGAMVGLRPAYIKRDSIAWLGEHRHKADGTNDIYAYSYLYKYHIPVAAGARTLTFPNNPNIKVFAVTAAQNPNEETRPAQLLYDTFAQPETAPTMTPAAGSYADAIAVSVQPPLYVTDATLRYTTDGSTPSASSPVYAGSFLLHRSADVKVRPFTPDGKAGDVTTARYNVNDVTPPSVRTVVGLPGSSMVRVSFSEPVEELAGSSGASYRITPDVAVRSVVLKDGGRTAEVTLAAPLEAGKDYSLSLRGVKDRAPSGNVVPTEPVTLKAATPAFDLTVNADGAPTVAGGTVRILGTPKAATGPAGPALTFNGQEDALVVENSAALNPESAISITAWVRPADWNGNRRIAQKGRNDSQYRLFAETGRLVFEIAGVGRAVAPLPEAGKWHHIAGTYDGSRVSLIVDGEPVASVEASGPVPVTNDALSIGTRFGRAPAGDHFSGEIANVRIYDAALHPEHIRALARQGSAG